MEVNPEDQLAKLDTYREQLAQVEEALELTPDEPSLVKLKNDLQEVIALTEDLVKYQATEQTGIEEEAKPAQPAPGQKQAHLALIGRTCEAFYDNKLYNAEILSIRRDERGMDRATVEIIGFKSKREYKLAEIRLLKPPHPAQCQPGTKVQAVFGEDGLWYDCLVTEQTEKGYAVTFTEYGNKEEVRFDRIRVGGKKDQKRTIKEIQTKAGYKIPETLVIKEDDDEEAIDTKKKKIRAVKSSQRQDIIDQQHVKAASSWQKFNNKASIRSKNGFLSGKAKESIFKAPDNMDGKVGVVGSGNKMTEFTERQKFTYNFI